MSTEEKLRVAIELEGCFEGYNEPDTIQPVYHYIDSVLQKYGISHIEGAQILNELRGAFSPKSNKNVITKILEFLESQHKFLLTKRKEEVIVDAVIIEEDDNKKIIQSNSTQSSLKSREVALLYYYKGIQITRKNGKNIAKKYGLKSGEKLYRFYTEYSHKTNRCSGRNTLTTTRNHLALLENVLKEIKGKKEAIDLKKDIKEFKNNSKAFLEI